MKFEFKNNEEDENWEDFDDEDEDWEDYDEEDEDI